MIASQKTMDALKSIGLNKYERNLWVALLSKGSATAGELAEMSKVPRSRCYDVLESLTSKGFIMLQTGKPLRYVSLPPREAMERAKKKIAEDAQEAEERLDTLAKSDSIKELEKFHRDNIKIVNSEEMTGSVKGRYAVLQHMGTMMKNAKKTVKIITTSAGFSEMAEHHGSHIKKISGRGVNVQVLAPVREQHTEIIKELSKYAEIKHLEGNVAGGRICIVDGQEFVMGLTDDEKTHPTQDIAFWSQSNHATASVVEPMFDMLWKSSKSAK